MKTLVTGANGFIGSAVTNALLGRGDDVICMVRQGSDLSNIESLPVTIVYAELSDRTAIRNAVQGCDAVFHLAADYRLWVPDPDVMYRTNVDGTRNVVMEAADAGVSRIVYTSSVATLGLLPGEGVADENTTATIDEMVSHYKRSKFLAEQEVCKLVEENNLPVVIINPSTPIGPGDIKPTPTGRIIYDAINGRIPAYVNTGLNIVHVMDIATGSLLAQEKGRIGERYILGGENLSLKELLTRIAAEIGQNPPRVNLPHSLVLPVAYILEGVAGIKGHEPRITVDAVKMSRHHMYFNSDKARRELGYDPHPVNEAIHDAVEWFRHFTPPSFDGHVLTTE